MINDAKTDVKLSVALRKALEWNLSVLIQFFGKLILPNFQKHISHKLRNFDIFCLKQV